MDKYTVIKSAIGAETCELIKTTLLMIKDNLYFTHKVDVKNRNWFAGDPTPENCCNLIAPLVTESLLLTLKPKIEEIAGCELLPTYSYGRVYWPGCSMRTHIDRDSCEVSASLCISVDPDPWPIFMNGDKLELMPGDLVVYPGPKMPHWREAYTGREQVQVFLHWVRADGEYKNLKFDRRPNLGLRTRTN